MSAEPENAGAARSLPSRPSWLTARVAIWAAAVLVVAAIALDTKFQDADEPVAGAPQEFDPEAFGRKNYPRVQAEVAKRAVPVGQLVSALKANQAAASKRFGRREGSSSYNFAVKGEGVAQEPRGGLMTVKAAGVPSGTRVSIQVGPALNGTALRDVAGFISFNKGFKNQVEYSQAASALNSQVKAKTLKGIDPASLKGKRVAFTGAFSFLTPTLLNVIPTRLEEAK